MTTRTESSRFAAAVGTAAVALTAPSCATCGLPPCEQLEPDTKITAGPNGEDITASVVAVTERVIDLFGDGARYRVELPAPPEPVPLLIPEAGAPAVISYWAFESAFEGGRDTVELGVGLANRPLVSVSQVQGDEQGVRDLGGDPVCVTPEGQAARLGALELRSSVPPILATPGQAARTTLFGFPHVFYTPHALVWDCSDEAREEGITVCGYGQLIGRALSNE